MPIFDVQANGKSFEVDAPDLQSATAALPKDIGGLPPSPMGAGGRFMTGFEDPLVGGSQLLTHTFGSTEQAKAADVGVQQREAELKAKGMESGDLMRGAGRMTATLPAMAVAGPVGGIAGATAGGAIGGALTEAVQPVTGGDYWSEKGLSTLTGAAFGAAGGFGVKTAGRGLAPRLGTAQRELAVGGVLMTPGQLAGGIPRRAEEAFKSFPILGNFIRGAEGRSLESFNVATLNQALEPIGVKLPSNVPAGHDAINYAYDALNSRYNALKPQMQLSTDKQFASDIANSRFNASSALNESENKQFDRILKDRLQRRFGDTGSISGEELKAADSELNELYRNNLANQPSLAAAIDDIRTAIRSALIRQNPQHAQELQSIDYAYAMFLRAQAAANRRTTSQGVFTPADLLAAIKAGDKTAHKGTFARGDALMQDWAEYAQEVLPGKMPDSGSPERAAHMGAGWALASNPWLALAGLGAVPYTRIGQRAIQGAATRMAQPGALRESARTYLEKAAPYVGTGIEPYLPKPFGSQ